MGINSEQSCSLMTDHHYTAVFVLEQNNTIRVDRGRFDTERICTNEPKQSQTPELQTSVYRQYSQCWPTEKITVHSVRTALSVCSLKHMHIQAVCLLHFSTYYPQATTAPLSFVCLCLPLSLPPSVSFLDAETPTNQWQPLDFSWSNSSTVFHLCNYISLFYNSFICVWCIFVPIPSGECISLESYLRWTGGGTTIQRLQRILLTGLLLFQKKEFSSE